MRQKKTAQNESYDFLESPIGTLFLVFRATTLIAISFSKPAFLPFRKTRESETVNSQLVEYFEKTRTDFTCNTEFAEGTKFEQKVWNILREIPYGETRTYKWVAEKTGQPNAYRAVGQALGKNPIPIIFACHRVIESDGALGGYSSGTEIKRRLLDLEYYTAQSSA